MVINYLEYICLIIANKSPVLLILIHFLQLYLNTLNILTLSSNCPPTCQVAVRVNLAVAPAQEQTTTDVCADVANVVISQHTTYLHTIHPPNALQYNHLTRNNELPLPHRRHRRPRRLEPEPQPARRHHTCRLQRPHKRHRAPLFRS